MSSSGKPVLVLVAILGSAIFAAAQNGTKLPPLDHFSLDQIDHTIDPCVNFYQYTCKKWIAANPIPSDQSFWGPDGKLQLWNESVLREVLDTASKDDPGRESGGTENWRLLFFVHGYAGKEHERNQRECKELNSTRSMA